LATIQSFPMPDISNATAILLVQAVVSRSDLRWEFANIAAAVAMSAVAGDFYDFLSIDERRVGILIADVTGHGVPAR
jgi:serine phosphatase RsbU (regulator of sigma subunit)